MMTLTANAVDGPCPFVEKFFVQSECLNARTQDIQQDASEPFTTIQNQQKSRVSYSIKTLTLDHWRLSCCIRWLPQNILKRCDWKLWFPGDFIAVISLFLNL